MPRLLVFAPCERVILDQKNQVTLVSLMEELEVSLPEPVPGVVVAHMGFIKWEAFTLWYRTEEDTNRTYEQTMTLMAPDGTPTGLNTIATFTMERRSHRIVGTIQGFPTHTGTYELKLLLKESGSTEAPREIGAFPVVLSRIEPKTNASSSA